MEKQDGGRDRGDVDTGEERSKRKSEGKDREGPNRKKKPKGREKAREKKREEESNDEEHKEKQFREYLRRVQAYVPLHERLLDLTKWGLAPSFVRLCAAPSSTHEDVLIPAGNGIYLIEVLTPEFCELITQEVDHFEDWCKREKIDVLRPNSMNNYGAVLDHIPGFAAVLQQFVGQFIEQLSRHLFPYLHPALESTSGPTRLSSLDSHHGFVVEYGMDKDLKLDWHVDDSDVTLNVCLGKSFEGGDLIFSGVRCALHRRDTPPLASKGENVRVAHLVGHGLLHVGKHRHAATPIQAGERTNLILWCRNSQFESSAECGSGVCPSWCGWHRMQG